MYTIQFYGYSTAYGVYPTLTKARKELAIYKREDKEYCRKKFGSVHVSGTKDSYQVTFGMNLYSAGSIVRY